MPIRDWVFGVICGSTATYVCVMLLGILLPSWPFNLFFTPLALACLLLQWSFWMVALDPNQR
ncbi:MAG TPA: hypothetical protein VLF16_15435, partial [Pseudomonas sp.]|nr:hypothetical protein [Pseudomonas sp.]